MDLGFEGRFASSWSRSEDHHVFINQESIPVKTGKANQCWTCNASCSQIAPNLGGSGVTRRDVHSASTNIDCFDYNFFSLFLFWYRENKRGESKDKSN